MLRYVAVAMQGRRRAVSFHATGEATELCTGQPIIYQVDGHVSDGPTALIDAPSADNFNRENRRRLSCHAEGRRNVLNKISFGRLASSIPFCTGCLLACILLGSPSAAADTINGHVLAAGRPIAGSTVTLWAESTSGPRELAQAQTGGDGRFTITGDGNGAILYVVAKGGRVGQREDNPAIALMSVLGSTVAPSVVVNEMTTIASVWTHAQFLDGDRIKGNPLGLKIAAGNVPNFVDLRTGGWGATIQDPLNSAQTGQRLDEAHGAFAELCYVLR